jgi:putative endonuclease
MPSSKPGSSDRDNRVERGRRFEELAGQFYKDIGFEIIERNYQAGHKEIDLVVRKDDIVVFVEVKSASNQKFGHPVERVDKRKIHNLTVAAQQYIIANDLTDVDLRFDIVTFSNGQLEHFPDAFSAE